MNGTAKQEATMTCEKCETACQRFGKHRNGLRRFRCPLCKKTYTETHAPALAGSYIPQDRIVLALRLLIEGNTIRSTERITNLDRNTIMKILALAGEKCEKIMGRLIVNIPVRDVRPTRFGASSARSKSELTSEDDPNLGDCYSFVAIERDTKLVLNFALGKRDQATTDIFIEGLRHATARQQFPDHHRRLRAVQIRDQQHAGRPLRLRATHQSVPGNTEGEGGTVPPKWSMEVVPVMGRPDPDESARPSWNARTSRSHVHSPIHSADERLQQEMGEPLGRVSLLPIFAFYNFCRIHQIHSRHSRDASRHHRSRLGLAELLS